MSQITLPPGFTLGTTKCGWKVHIFDLWSSLPVCGRKTTGFQRVAVGEPDCPHCAKITTANLRKILDLRADCFRRARHQRG